MLICRIRAPSATLLDCRWARIGDGQLRPGFRIVDHCSRQTVSPCRLRLHRNISAGAAGLIDGKQVVTHWQFCDRLANEFPHPTVGPEPIFLKDDPIYTSAGITAGIDLALALVEEDHGHRSR